MFNKLLNISNLSVNFEKEGKITKAVDGIDFTVFEGETLGIVGESGSGKSVTSLSVMRLIPEPPGKIASGTIDFYGEKGPTNLLNLSETEMNQYRGNQIAMIFQEPMTSLNPVFTCGNQVMEAVQLHLKLNKTEGKKHVLSLFEKVKLPDPERVFNAYPHELSGGQKQRVMIAMALSCNPKLLIADEPTTALDVTVQKAILELMAELKKEINAAVIFISHDLGVIAEIADRVLVMYKGKIVEQGTVEEIFKNPKHPYTKGLLACRPPLGHRLKRLPVIRDFMNIETDAAGNISITEKENSGSDSKIGAIRESVEERQERMKKLTNQDPILQVKNLKTWFPTKKNFFGKPTAWVKAVDNVSFDVYPGETLGLVGESGCGKTTLGRSIMRLNEPMEGEIIYKGKNLLSLNRSEMREYRRDIQMIFQDPYSSLNPRMTIGQAISEPIEVHQIIKDKKERKDFVVDLMETVGLRLEHFDRFPHEFSGGQRQRVGIARALALDPKFLICDESVSALDVSVQAQVLNLLLELQEKRKLTYIFISHDLSVVKFMSDRMMVMNKGKIEELDDADRIYNAPETGYTRRLIEAIPVGIL